VIAQIARARSAETNNSSCGLDPRTQVARPHARGISMDCRVKPGNDEGKGWSIETIIALSFRPTAHS
jgi:hypothetical protein